MKPLLVGLTLLVPSACALAQPPELVWETDGFVAPESAVFDPARNQFYVSNMGSHGKEAVPGDGFISRVSAEGKILELKWVTGLDNPKGLALVRDRLYAGDDQALFEIDVAGGKIANRHAPADGPGSFNDCTADAAGNVYVFSGRLHTVFRLSGGKFEAWARPDKALTGGINGLHAARDHLLLGGWSLRRADGQEQLGHLSTVGYADQSLGRLGDQPIGHIDGIEPDGRGGYTVTDWLTGDVAHVTAGGAATRLCSLGKGTADHTYLIDKKLLIIPQMMENKVRAFRWAPAGN